MLGCKGLIRIKKMLKQLIMLNFTIAVILIGLCRFCPTANSPLQRQLRPVEFKNFAANPYSYFQLSLRRLFASGIFDQDKKFSL